MAIDKMAIGQKVTDKMDITQMALDKIAMDQVVIGPNNH